MEDKLQYDATRRSRQAGCQQKTVGEWEKEDAELKGIQLYALAKLFNTEVDFIKAKKI